MPEAAPDTAMTLPLREEYLAGAPRVWWIEREDTRRVGRRVRDQEDIVFERVSGFLALWLQAALTFAEMAIQYNVTLEMQY